MIAKIKYKYDALNLRRQGLSYQEIRQKIPVAKSTLSLWLKNVRLTSDQRRRLYTKQVAILSQGSKSQKNRRDKEVKNIIEQAKRDIKLPLDFQSQLLFGTALYWAEGTKGRALEITNSDPHLILFMVKWLENIFSIKSKDLKAQLNMYSQQNENKIKKFWAELTGVPLANFGKSYIKPPNKNYKKNNLYYGTIKIRVPKSTDLSHRVFGWVQSVLLSIDPEVVKTQRKWLRLKKTAKPVNLQ